MNYALFRSTYNAIIFLVAGLASGSLSTVRPVILTSILSQLTPTNNQGSIFAVVSSIEDLSGMVTEYYMTALYSATVASFRGAVYVVGCAFQILALSIFR